NDKHPIGSGVDAAHRVINLPAKSDAFGSTLRTAFNASPARSALHAAIIDRVSRRPIEIPALLGKHYPDQPAISYIPAVSWVNTLKLAAINGDQSLEQKVRDQTAPWVKGQPLFGPRIQLTSVAGTMIFADLGGGAELLAVRGAELAARRKADGVAEYGQGWTDDMFMAAAVLARVGRMQGQDERLNEAARLLVDYSAKL